MSHTKTPWQLDDFDDPEYIFGPKTEMIAQMRGVGAQLDIPANARLIVRAVNAFEPMREALEHCEALVVGWACHHAMQGAQTNADYEKATSIEGWHPVHRKIYEDLKAALALAEKEKP